MNDRYFVRAPSRVYVCEMNEKGRQTDIANLYQYSTGVAYKLDALGMAERITILLNAFDGVPTEKLAAHVKRLQKAKAKSGK